MVPGQKGLSHEDDQAFVSLLKQILGCQPDQHRLLGKTVDSDANGTVDTSEVYVQDGNQIVARFEGTGASLGEAALTERYLWGTAVDQILAEEVVDDGTADDVLWTVTDHQNTVRILIKYDPTTDTTSVVRSLNYDSFGNMVSQTSPTVETLFQFTGRLFDADTGLQNNLNRWYDPEIARWLSEDPISFAAGDANLYRYVSNNPAVKTDPSGLADYMFGLYFLNNHYKISTAPYNSRPRNIGHEMMKLSWLKDAKWGSLVFPRAGAYLIHYLENEGLDIVIPYSKLIADVVEARVAIKKEINKAIDFAESTTDDFFYISSRSATGVTTRTRGEIGTMPLATIKPGGWVL